MSEVTREPRLEPALGELLERHRAFWARTPMDRPLLQVREYADLNREADVPLRGGRRAAEGTPIDPEELDLDALVARQRVPASPIDGRSSSGQVRHRNSRRRIH